MVKIICPYIMCVYNTSEIPEGKGKCKKEGVVELKVKDIHEIAGFEDGVPDELEDECLMNCDSFIYSTTKGVKINE